MSLRTTVLAALSIIASASFASAATVYNSLPSPTPDNVPSLGYQATSTQEFGDDINLAGTERVLQSVTVGLSDWAKKSDWPAVGTATDFTHPITVNVYAVDHTGATPAVGSLLATMTNTVTVPYRPEVYSANGIYFETTFDLSSLNVTLPDEVIATVAYNTYTHGASPIGVDGPWSSLNVGLLDSASSVGSDADADAVFWNTSVAGFYTDGGLAGVGTLRQDTAWTPYTPTMSIDALDVSASVPEPTTFAAVIGAGAMVLRRRRVAK